jgi:hypothetical protein
MSKNDVDQLITNASIAVTLAYGMKREDIFTYTLKLIENGLSQVNVEQNKIEIIILYNELKNWLTNESMISYERIFNTHALPLTILIERDFKCLTPRKEDESDLFENLNTVC